MVVTITMFPKGWVAWSKSWGNLLCSGRLPGGDHDQLVTLLEVEFRCVTRWKVSFSFAGEKSWQCALLAAGEGDLERGGNQVDDNRDDEDGDDEYGPLRTSRAPKRAIRARNEPFWGPQECRRGPLRGPSAWYGCVPPRHTVWKCCGPHSARLGRPRGSEGAKKGPKNENCHILTVSSPETTSGAVIIKT